MKANKRNNKISKLGMDKQVQILLGKFFDGKIDKIRPTFDKQKGYRYLDVEALLDNPEEAEPFILELKENGLLTSETCGVIACCTKCHSYDIKNILLGESKDALRCQNCGSNFKKNTIFLKPILCYEFNKKRIEQLSNVLISKPLIDFLRGRGYKITSPGKLTGRSGVKHVFDIIAYNTSIDEGSIVIDFEVSDKSVEDIKIKQMFAKVFDTKPLKSILVIFPRLSEKSRKLANQYNINVVETNNPSSLWKDMLRVIPPVNELRFEMLDVMTLLTLPDHLRKTAAMISNFGKASANDVATATKRARAVESSYLNQLVRMGYLSKERSGRKVIFSVNL